MASPEELDMLVLEQYKPCYGVVSEMLDSLTKKGYNITKSYIISCLKSESKVPRKLSDVLRKKIKKYHRPVPGNLYKIQEKIAKNTPFRPSDYTLRKIMNKLELKVIPRPEKVVKAERLVQPKRPIRRRVLSKEKQRAFRYCDSADIYGRAAG